MIATLGEFEKRKQSQQHTWPRTSHTQNTADSTYVRTYMYVTKQTNTRIRATAAAHTGGEARVGPTYGLSMTNAKKSPAKSGLVFQGGKGHGGANRPMNTCTQCVCVCVCVYLYATLYKRLD